MDDTMFDKAKLNEHDVIMKLVTDLNHEEARNYFLQDDSYVNFETPPYFKFSKLLEGAEKNLNNKPLNFEQVMSAKKEVGVNYHIYSNKDGRYAWRRFEIINPFLYVSLVNTITSEDSWNEILKSLPTKNSKSKIKCMSLPVATDSAKKNKAEQLSNWYNMVERKSVQMAISYKKLYVTDISDCYGQYYTHAISWALHTVEISKQRRKYSKLLGNRIDAHLQAMNNGQTNGIPQGSNLMDLMAEILLCWSDKLLEEKLETRKVTDYEIIRYKDDYKIFVNSDSDGDIILSCLSEILSELGMRINDSKTFASTNVVLGSLKPDKRHLMKFPPAEYKAINFNSVRKELLYIASLAESYPNCGSVHKRLQSLHDKLLKSKHKFSFVSTIELTSILAHIGINNPRTFPFMSAIISRLIKHLNEKRKKEIVLKVIKCFHEYPNSGYFDIWMQRTSLKVDTSIEYKESLSRLADGIDESIFNNEWLKMDNLELIKSSSIIDKKIITEMEPVIQKSEVDTFFIVS